MTCELAGGNIRRVAAGLLALVFAFWLPAGRGVAQDGPKSVAPVAERLIDAVVNISTSQTVKGPKGVPLPSVPKGSPFEEFFEDFFQRGPDDGEGDKKVSSLGSGFVIDGKEGLIVTNHHVIDGADEIIVNFHDGSKLKVEKVLGKDAKTDLALLKVTPKKPLTQVKFATADAVKVGDWVMAIGNPFGLGGTVTVGIISAKERNINSGPYDDYLQTDAAINKGNSGGPLFNMIGDVIGVNTAIISPTGGSIGIGFAVPAQTAVVVLDQLRQFGETRRGWLGVKIQTVPEDVAKSLGIETTTGAYISAVTPGGPAEKAGIQPEDVITKFDGKGISSVRGLPRVVASTPVGKKVPVELLRKGKTVTVSVEVGRLKEDEDKAAGAAGAKVDAPLVGLKLEPVTPDTRKKFKLRDGVRGVVVTEVDPKSAAAKKNIKAGDVIVEVAGEAVASVADIGKRIAAVRKTGRGQVLLQIESAGGGVRSVSVPIK
ncbi:MAG: hypothetical protein RLZ98_909 [Pseudomonadota bacterium]